MADNLLPPTNLSSDQALPAELKPVADLLANVAADPSEKLDPARKTEQKQHLLEQIATKTDPEIIVPSPLESSLNQRSPRRSPLNWRRMFAVGGLALALGIVVLVVVNIKISPTVSAKLARVDDITRLAIPAAEASTAFDVKQDVPTVGSTSTATDFILTSRIPLTTDQVQQTIQILPAVPTKIISLTANEFRIEPQIALASGQVYKIALPTLLTNTDGTQSPRDFSWALQTPDELRVVTTVPGDAASGVPLDSGLEFTLNHEGFSDVTSSFAITPTTSGRFEIHERTIAFVPDEPLQPETEYVVTLKQGLQTMNSGLTLMNDTVIHFETASQNPNTNLAANISFPSEFYEVFPNTAIQIPLYDQSPSSTDLKLDVQGFALSVDQAEQLLQARLAIPHWTQFQAQHYAAYTQVATNQAFHLTGQLTNTGNTGSFMLMLPKMSQSGFFAVHVTPATGTDAWIFLQVTPIASYTVADKDHLFVWAVDGTTNQPVSQAIVRLNDEQTTTDAQGVAQLSSPAILTATTSVLGDNPSFNILRISHNQDEALVVVNGAQPFYASAYSPTALATTWGYVFPDRALYHPTDELNFFGIAQDRTDQSVPANLTLRLTRPDEAFDVWTGQSKIYQEIPLTPDASGRFTGKMDWNNLTAGFYSVDLMRAGELVSSRSIEIRDFVKPAYYLDVETNASQVYDNQDVQGTIQAAFYDGTPVPLDQLTLTMNQGQASTTQNITLDQNGQATFDVKAASIDCTERNSCSGPQAMSIEVRPASGEEGEIIGTANALVYPSELDIRTTQTVVSSTARLVIQTYHRDLMSTSTDPLATGPVWTGRTLQGQVVGYYFVPVQNGTYYDYTDKIVKPNIQYETRQDPPITFQVTTDQTGQVVYQFPFNPKREYYAVTLQGEDTQSRPSNMTALVEPDNNGYSDVSDVNIPHLAFAGDDDSRSDAEFNLNDSVTVKYEHGNQPLDVSQTPGVFFLVGSRELGTPTVTQQPNYTFTYNADLVPNAQIRAVTFYNHQFESAEATASLSKNSRTLQLSVTADQASYAPGSEVHLHVQAQAVVPGDSLKDVEVAYAAVDKSLIELAGQPDEDPVSSLYADIPDSVLYENFSHPTPGSEFDGGGDGLGGGGGDDEEQTAARHIFKDTAAFGTVSLDASGQGDITFTVPDNLTSWQVTLVGLSSDLQAGTTKIDVPVTKPLFIQAVIPPRLLTTDQPVLKLEAFGSALTPSSSVQFTVNAPTLGLNQAIVTSTADVPTYLNIPQALTAGTHSLLLQVASGSLNDAIVQNVQVNDSNFLHDQAVTLNVLPGLKLPPLGASEANITITSQGRAALLPLVRSLAWVSSARSDVRVAQIQAQTLLQTIYHEDPSTDQPSLDGYQDSSGGLKLLTYAAPDVDLSSHIAALAPEAFDEQTLTDYFSNVLMDASSTSDMQLQALTGLAELNQPVLSDLQQLAQTNLSLGDSITVARGLAAAGDMQTARTLMNNILEQATTDSDGMFIPVSSSTSDVYAATADTAALASELGDSRADALAQYVEKHWSDDQTSALAKVFYLKYRLAALPVQDGSVTWSVNGKTDSINLQDQSVFNLTLTADEASSFQITQANGLAQIELIQRVPGRPTSVPNLTIDRSYADPNGLDMHDGDLIQVTLTPHWQTPTSDAEQNSCYEVYDHLPGGWELASPVGVSDPDSLQFPYDLDQGEVSFITCNSSSSTPIIYVARIVSRGTYTAEAPLIENIDDPSIAAVGTDQTVTVN